MSREIADTWATFFVAVYTWPNFLLSSGEVFSILAGPVNTPRSLAPVTQLYSCTLPPSSVGMYNHVPLFVPLFVFSSSCSAVNSSPFRLLSTRIDIQPENGIKDRF